MAGATGQSIGYDAENTTLCEIYRSHLPLAIPGTVARREGNGDLWAGTPAHSNLMGSRAGFELGAGSDFFDGPIRDREAESVFLHLVLYGGSHVNIQFVGQGHAVDQDIGQFLLEMLKFI